MARRKGQIIIEDARIIFRNFEGRETKFNRKGDRNFSVVLDNELAEKLKKDEWNVKYLRPRDEGDEPTPHLQVSVSCKNSCPMIALINQDGSRNFLSEEEFANVDFVDIEQVDMIINPYHWDVNGSTGIKAYLESIYVYIIEDPLEMKYKDMGKGPEHHIPPEEFPGENE